MPVSRDFSHSFLMKGGVKITATIPLYCFGWPVLKAIDLKDETGASVRVEVAIDRDDDDSVVKALVEKQELPFTACKCGAMTIQQAGYYRKVGECETCVRKQLDAEYKAAEAKEKVKEAKKEAKLFKDGYRFKFVGWVHPARGDDYQVVSYSQSRPTEAECRTILRKRRSTTTGDYAVTELTGELQTA